MLMGRPATDSACGILVLLLQLTLTALFTRWMLKQKVQHSLLLVLVFISYTHVCVLWWGGRTFLVKLFVSSSSQLQNMIEDIKNMKYIYFTCDKTFLDGTCPYGFTWNISRFISMLSYCFTPTHALHFFVYFPVGWFYILIV